MFTRQLLTNCREWLENENKYNFPNKSAILSIYYSPQRSLAESSMVPEPRIWFSGSPEIFVNT